MKIITAKSIVNGIGIGNLYLFQRISYVPEKKIISDTHAEVKRFLAAKSKAIEHLKGLYETAITQVGKEAAMIFDVHQMMLEDERYVNSITKMIQKEHLNGEYAVSVTGKRFAEELSALNDDNVKARSADIRDLSEQVICLLAGVKRNMPLTDPVILAADDLYPSEIVNLDKSKIAGFVIRKGASNSHTCILARSLNIPTLIHMDTALTPELHNKMAIVDGFTGKLYIDPQEAVLREFKEQCFHYKEEIEKLRPLENQDGSSPGKEKIKIYANLTNLEDLESALEENAEGIGLLRSEFIYLGRYDLPTEEEQFQIYKFIISKMDGKKVIIRTLDLGADKQSNCLPLEKEENPAMGCRGIRICLKRIDLFHEQLRAIYRASAYGRVSIMFPMIISLWEIKTIKEIIKKVQDDLKKEDIPMGNVEMGIMIETPAAVMISDLLAREVDFFSIGTNDLTQFTLAVDRQNGHLDWLYDPHHEAILRMIRMTVENGHKEGIWVGICGELAADESLSETFLNMGLDELSVSPPHLRSLRKHIREMK